MPDVTLYCPACNRKLRAPESELGQTVQCPLCSVTFTAPVRMPAPPAAPAGQGLPAPAAAGPAGTLPQPPPGAVVGGIPDGPRPLPPPRAGAPVSAPSMPPRHPRGLLIAPAIALLLTGFFSLIATLLNLVVLSILGPEGIMEMFGKLAPNVPLPPIQGAGQTMLPTVLNAGFIALTVLIMAGGVQMLRLRMYWLALLGSIATLFNIQNCCCLLTAPVGIWAFVVLLQPEVRDAFK